MHVITQSIINWDEIKSYQCNFSNSLTTDIVLFLKDNSKKRFVFLDEKNQDQAIEEKSVFSILHYYITQYNLKQSNNDTIFFKKSFDELQ